jgi:murein DD-endopeptidase MepM/ murein hydrolase activator NlpD
VRPFRFLGAALVAALALPALASAHTDGPRPLAFIWPAEGTITSPFGQDGGRWHPGLDIGILRSLTIRAAAPGRVVRVGEQRGYEGYGRIVEVAVGGGYDLLYAHLESPGARVGEWVSAGQPIGIAGCTGWCTGTHLHFELRERGHAIDPTPFLSGPAP